MSNEFKRLVLEGRTLRYIRSQIQGLSEYSDVYLVNKMLRILEGV